jgi:hypothetical protein
MVSCYYMFMSERFDLSNVPEKCRRCPEVCELIQSLQILENQDRLTKEAAERLVGTTGELLDTAMEQAFGDRAEDLATFVRQSTAEQLDMVEEEIDFVADEITALTSSCEGVVNLRATKKNKTYTVRVCGSDEAYDPELSHYDHRTMHIDVKNTD